MSKKVAWIAVTLAVTSLLVLAITAEGAAQSDLSDMEQLGKFLYFDEGLSQPDGQACASCHEPTVGFDDPDSDLPVSEGIHAGRFGDRNSPASAYAMYAPAFHWDGGEGLFIGGQFWDGRATGEELGDPLADQALGPFLNPVEMANLTKATVVAHAARGEYGRLFREVCGASGSGGGSYVEQAYDCIATAIGAFERTDLFAQFDSKYDAYLQACLTAGGTPDDCATGNPDSDAVMQAMDVFSAEEWAGFQLFMNGTNDNDGTLEAGEGAMCVLCHVADWTDPNDLANPVVVPDWAPEGMIPPMFTDFTYDNLGVPKNWDNPFLYQDPAFNPDGAEFVDLGLARFLAGREDLWPTDPMWTLAGEEGKFKVMTLRNIGLTAPYAHNGFFMDNAETESVNEGLKEITHFYNTRDVESEGWPAPEVPDTVNFDELGKLGLSDADEDNLVAFMMTLSDGWER